MGAVMVTTPMASSAERGRKVSRRILRDHGTRRKPSSNRSSDTPPKPARTASSPWRSEAGSIADPFLRKALNLAVDGTDLQELRRMMELDITLEEQRGEAEAKVYEAAGGYAPTIGIIGAVLGLIQVMKHLANIDEVGQGIAVAFVATVYGVASANIFFLPAGGKLRSRMHAAVQMRELMLEGVLGIAEGLNPKLIRIKLEAYAPPPTPDKTPEKLPKAKRPPASPRQPRPGIGEHMTRRRKAGGTTSITNAGWSLMRISLPCCLPFSW